MKLSFYILICKAKWHHRSTQTVVALKQNFMFCDGVVAQHSLGTHIVGQLAKPFFSPIWYGILRYFEKIRRNNDIHGMCSGIDLKLG
jgi:hypothetical protein